MAVMVLSCMYSPLSIRSQEKRDKHAPHGCINITVDILFRLASQALHAFCTLMSGKDIEASTLSMNLYVNLLNRCRFVQDPANAIRDAAIPRQRRRLKLSTEASEAVWEAFEDVDVGRYAVDSIQRLAEPYEDEPFCHLPIRRQVLCIQ